MSDAADAERNPGTVERWGILLSLSLGVCVSNGFARFAYGLILPAMREDRAWTYAQAGWINTANALGYLAGAVLTFALVRRRWSPAGLFAAGMIGVSVSLLLSGLAEGFALLTLWRVAAGIAGAPVFIAGGILAAALFPDNRRTALAIALYYGGGGVGMVLSGAALPALFASFGPGVWPAAWIGLGLASAACCLVSIRAVRRLGAVTADRPPATVAAALSDRLPIGRMAFALVGYALFATGYIVHVTFLVAWMGELRAGPALVSATWIVIGLAIVASPFAWRGVLGHFDDGVPLALATGVTALGALLPLLWSGTAALVASSALFGLAIFIAPAAATSFARRNLPPDLQASGIALFTVVFAAGQVVGPVAAGAIGDAFGAIDIGLMAAGAVLTLGAVSAFGQRSLASAKG